MPGSDADNPVRIGPFKRLVEVGWPNMIVFRRTVKTSSTGGSSNVCTPGIGVIPDGYTQVYTDSTFLLYESGGDAVWTRGGGEWVSASPGGLSLTGMPVLPDDTVQTYGYMEMHLISTPWQSPVDGAPIDPLLPVPPEAGSGDFANGVSISIDVLGNMLSGGTSCYAPPGGGPEAFESKTYDAQTVLGSAPFDLAGVVAELGGKAYRPVATRLVDNTTPDTGTVDIYVLCRRSQADDPTA